MREYLFKVLLAEGGRFLPIEAENTKDARKIFAQYMKDNYKGELEWFLIAVYREVKCCDEEGE